MEMAMSGLEDGYQVHVGYTDESRDNDDDERENGHVEYHDDRYYGEFHEDDQQRENDGQSRERESGFHDLSASSLITNSEVNADVCLSMSLGVTQFRIYSSKKSRTMCSLRLARKPKRD